MLRQFRQKRLLGGCGAYPSVRTSAAYSGSYWSSYLEIYIRHYVRAWPNPVVRRAKSERQVSTLFGHSACVEIETPANAGIPNGPHTISGIKLFPLHAAVAKLRMENRSIEQPARINLKKRLRN